MEQEYIIFICIFYVLLEEMVRMFHPQRRRVIYLRLDEDRVEVRESFYNLITYLLHPNSEVANFIAAEHFKMYLVLDVLE